jgi:hypothetical protein
MGAKVPRGREDVGLTPTPTALRAARLRNTAITLGLQILDVIHG